RILSDPNQIWKRPCSYSERWTLARAQQEFAQPMTCPQLILLRRFARTHQIAQRLGTLVQNPHRRQIVGSVTARQLLGIPAIDLHPVSGLDRYQRWRNHLALHA